jgi:hypothetical protein
MGAIQQRETSRSCDVIVQQWRQKGTYAVSVIVFNAFYRSDAFGFDEVLNRGANTRSTDWSVRFWHPVSARLASHQDQIRGVTMMNSARPLLPVLR